MLDVAATAGRPRINGSTGVIAGAQRAFTAKQKTWHGLARAVRRGIHNMKIQAYLTAAAINLKRLAAALLGLLWLLLDVSSRPAPLGAPTT